MQLEQTLENLGVNPHDAAAISGSFELRQYAPNQRIVEEGGASDRFYLVKSGELLVSKLDHAGQDRTLAVLSPGDLFGEIGLLREVNRTASITTLSHSQLYELGREHFNALLGSNPAFAEFLQQLHLVRALQNVPLFSRLDSAALEVLAGAVEINDIGETCTLVNQGEVVRDMYLPLEGTLKLEQAGDATPLVVGEPVGEKGLLATSRHAATLIADAGARVARLNRARFLNLVRKTPAIALKLPGISLLKALLPLFVDKSALLFLPDFAMNRPRHSIRAMLVLLMLLLIPALLPNLSPSTFPFLTPLTVDTNPENMLADSEPVRQYHKLMKRRMDLHDMIVVGVVNEDHPQGVFNRNTLSNVHELSDFASNLTWPDPDSPGQFQGVIKADVLSPSTVDVINQDGQGAIRFDWLMHNPPADDEEALAILDNIKRFPMMSDVIASADGKALAIYLPITSKEISFRVYRALKEKVNSFEGRERYHITGLPVAEDVFGVEMFIQMAVAAPLAMIAIFLLMLYYFKSFILVLSPMVVAMVSVMGTMALLIVTGHTVHIMSSMIAIFVMPIAVLDSVHILSEFFDNYPRIRDKRLTLNYVMRELFTPMLFTSITTAIGFASLSLVPIPPVQVFGVFVAVGVALAWLLSITIIPAYIILMSDTSLEKMAAARQSTVSEAGTSRPLFRFIHGFTRRYSAVVVTVIAMLSLVCVYGITRIVVNDNPVRWFSPGHDIRIADEVLNRHMGGTYMAYLTLSSAENNAATGVEKFSNELKDHLQKLAATLQVSDHLVAELVQRIRPNATGIDQLQEELIGWIEFRLDTAQGDDYDLMEAALDYVESYNTQLFKNPEMLSYLAALQQHLEQSDIVGKSISLADFSKTVYRELLSGKDQDYRLPDSARGVAQTLLTYQNSHRPQDLWHSVTPDYNTSVIWLLLKSGDNLDMQQVVDRVENYVADHPPPGAVTMDWFGLTYVNVIWQNKMVTGMLSSIVGSFLAVWLLMIILLRSWVWGLIAMLPLSATILIIYGLLGLTGTPFDMPIAVLSSLSIGLAVDFTIHFLVRIRHIMSQTNSAEMSLKLMYGEPALAIWRNMVVVAIGFLPLLLSPLVPYQTVGKLIAIILSVSGIATLVLLPSILGLWRERLFPQQDPRRTTVYGPRDGVVAGIVLAVLIGSNVDLVTGQPASWAIWAVLLLVIPVVMYSRASKNL